MDKVYIKLQEIQRFLSISNDNFIGTFLYGSQNYDLDNGNSDIDTITIIQSANKPKQELTTPYGKAKIYTLKYFIHRLKQGDLECYEILYTQYNILNNLYKKAWIDFVQAFSENINYARIKRSLGLKLQEHLQHIFQMITGADNTKYNKKRLYWAIRVSNQLERIDQGENFKDTLKYQAIIPYDLQKIKTITNYITPDALKNILQYLNQILFQPRQYNNTVTEQEEKVLSKLYKTIIDFNKKI